MSNNSGTVLGAFSEEDAIKLSGVSLHQLKSWDSKGILNASFARQNRKQAYSRIYSFRDLVSLRILNLLRNQHRVSGQHLAKVASKLAHLGDEKWTKTTLYILGKKVVFDDPQDSERKEIVSGQRVFDIPLRAAISDTLLAIKNENIRQKHEIGNVVKKRFLQNNQEVFQGTRVTVKAVQHYLERGFSTKEILLEFPDLAEADVRMAKQMLKPSAA